MRHLIFLPLLPSSNETDMLWVQGAGSPLRHSIDYSQLSYENNDDNDVETLILEVSLQIHVGVCRISLPEFDAYHNFSYCELVSHIGGYGSTYANTTAIPVHEWSR